MFNAKLKSMAQGFMKMFVFIGSRGITLYVLIYLLSIVIIDQDKVRTKILNQIMPQSYDHLFEVSQHPLNIGGLRLIMCTHDDGLF